MGLDVKHVQNHIVYCLVITSDKALPRGDNGRQNLVPGTMNLKFDKEIESFVNVVMS
jgi:hypothetical protein